MIEENDEIFLAGDDALMYLTWRMHKKYSAIFVWGHPSRTYVFFDRSFNPPPLLRI